MKIRKVRSVLVLSYAAIAVISLFIIGFISLKILGNHIEHDLSTDNRILAKSVGREIDRFMNEPYHILSTTSKIISSAGPISSSQNVIYLKAAIENFPLLESIQLIDDNGILRHNIPESKEMNGIDMSGQDFYKELIISKKPIWSSTFISMQSGHPTLTIAHPVKGGLIVGYLNLERLREIISGIKPEGTGFIAVVDENGTFIAHTDSNMVMERRTETYFNFLRSKNNSDSSFVLNYNNKEVLVSAAFLETNNWTVITYNDLEAEIAPVNFIRYIFIAGGTILFLLILVISYTTSVRILSPLDNIIKTVEKISSGNYEGNVRDSQFSEYNYLARQFNDMIHNIKEREGELISARMQAEESNRLKTSLLANLNHEFRTPLTGILGLSDILKDILNDREQQHIVGNIIKSANRLLGTLTSILDLSELESGRKIFSREELCLNEEVINVAEAFRQQALQKGLKLSVISDSRFIIEGSRDFTYKIAVNLIDNALKYTAEGEITVSFFSDSRDGKDLACFSVRDTGIGVDSSLFEIIFREFRQASEGFSRSFEGTGLGLSIARKMVEAMNGQIKIESELSKGSVFTVSFPLLKEVKIKNDKDKIPEPAQYEEPDPKVKTNEISAAEKPCVLLVEDNFINKEVITRYLEDICVVEHARNGLAAITKAKSRVYAAILMDINLGAGINGIEASQAIRKSPEYSSVPIIAVTGYSLNQEKEELLKSGFSYYLPKPFEKWELENIVNQALTESQTLQ
ncbi:MAG: ATP-binding protein [Syntrophothermus sp.]